MLQDLARLSRELLSVDTARRAGPDSLLGRLTDLLFYGDFEIFEQVASVSDADHTNLVGYKYGRSMTGGLLLSASLGMSEDPAPCVRADPREDRRAALRDGRVFGAGATSGRLALLAQLVAASSFRRGELARPVMVAGTFGEEHRGSGTQFLLESGHVSPEWVVVGGATNLEVVRAHRGYMVFVVEIAVTGDRWRRGFPARRSSHVVVPGRTAPSVLPGAGWSAFDRALALLAALPDGTPFGVHGLNAGSGVNRVPGRCEFDLLSAARDPLSFPADVRVDPLPEDSSLSIPVGSCLAVWQRLWPRVLATLRERPLPKAPDFEPAHVLANVGRVETTATGLAVSFDYRLLPGEDPYALFQIVEGIAAEVAAADGAHTIEIRVTVNRPAMALPRHSALTAATERALAGEGLLPVHGTLASYTDGAMYASCDIDTVVCGPGWWGDAAAFGVGESVGFHQLELAVKTYQDLIRQLCS